MRIPKTDQTKFKSLPKYTNSPGFCIFVSKLCGFKNSWFYYEGEEKFRTVLLIMNIIIMIMFIIINIRMNITIGAYENGPKAKKTIRKESILEDNLQITKNIVYRLELNFG